MNEETNIRIQEHITPKGRSLNIANDLLGYS